MSRSQFIELCQRKDLLSNTAFTLTQILSHTIGVLPECQDLFWDATPETAKEIVANLQIKQLEKAWNFLDTKLFLSFHGAGLKDIQPLSLLPHLETVVLSGNPDVELSPLRSLPRLRKLHLGNNELKDLRLLGEIKSLEYLDLRGNTPGNLIFLADLPALKELHLSTEPILSFSGCPVLRALETLHINGCGSFNLASLPPLPSLINFQANGLDSLDGLDKFSVVENLSLKGSFASLRSLIAFQRLTHLELWTDKPLDGSELPTLPHLKSLAFRAPSVSHIRGGKFARLSEFRLVDGTAVDTSEKANVEQSLISWDVDFLHSAPRFSPSSKLEIVSTSEFQLFNGRKAYGLNAEDKNYALLQSERAWLLARIGKALSEKLHEGKDFDLPHDNGMFRSNTLALSSRKAGREFGWIASQVQNELSHAKNDWIIYCGALEHLDFDVWIYPDRLVTMEPYAPVIRKCLKPWWSLFGGG